MRRCPHGILREYFACPGCGDKEEPKTKKRATSVQKTSRFYVPIGYRPSQPKRRQA